jgi:hypothetical protein
VIGKVVARVNVIIRDGTDTSVNDDSIDGASDGRRRWTDMPEIWDETTPDRVVNGRQI